MLDSWRRSPARFREDANAEEDLALGGYRNRLVVELATNAADAATRAGVAGRLLLRCTGRALLAANIGAGLDAAGVEALSTLRASAKRDGDTVGRFGVGFAAVLAVTDTPAVLSTTTTGAGGGTGVQWSRSRTAELVRDSTSLQDELARRSGRVPVLRLPFPAAGEVPTGYDTVVSLPLRDEAAATAVRALLAELDPTLLLALPALAEIVVEQDSARRRLAARPVGAAGGPRAEVVVTDDDRTSRWLLRRAGGSLPAGLVPQLLADRPTEERGRRSWSLTWAVPLDAAGEPAPLPAGVPAVVRAPTPTEEPLDLPAVLIADLPLEPDRRRVPTGPLRDHVLAQAARAYGDLLRDLPPTRRVLPLLPSGLAAGELDAVLRREIAAVLAGVPFLPAAADPGVRLRPPDAVALDLGAPAVQVLAAVLPGLLPAGWSGPALTGLGVRSVSLAELVELLGGLDREPAWWRSLYRALDGSVGPGPAADALYGLPVPLADGRLVVGPRGLLLPTAQLPTGAVAGLGLRLVHPDAVDPLLSRLGAVDASARVLLDQPAVRAAIAASYEEEDPQPVAAAVLALVRAADLLPGERPELAELALPGADGEWYPAGELLLPGGRLAGVVAADAPFGFAAPALVAEWGATVLTAVGVLASFAVLLAVDVPLEPLHDLDREAEWLAAVTARLPTGDLPPVVTELVAVRDLELVAPEKWPAALALLAEPPLRAAVTEPALVRLGDDRRVAVPSYTRWWLATSPVLDGRRPADLRLVGGEPLLAGLYDDAPAGDETWLRALGVVTGLDDVEPAELLERLADPTRPVPRGAVPALHARLAATGVPAAPARVRAVRAGRLVVVPAAEAVVVDAPDLLPLLGDRAVAPAPLGAADAVADLLDLPLAGELADYPLRSTGRRRAVPAVVRTLLPGAPAWYVAHPTLLVDDADGRSVAVPWRVVAGVPHATPAGLGRALAWTAGRWGLRDAVDAVLRDPAALATVLAEADLEDW